MSKAKGNVYGAVVLYEKKHKRTSIGGGRVKTSSMNKTNEDHIKNITEVENRYANRSKNRC